MEKNLIFVVACLSLAIQYDQEPVFSSLKSPIPLVALNGFSPAMDFFAPPTGVPLRNVPAIRAADEFVIPQNKDNQGGLFLQIRSRRDE